MSAGWPLLLMAVQIMQLDSQSSVILILSILTGHASTLLPHGSLDHTLSSYTNDHSEGFWSRSFQRSMPFLSPYQ